MSQPASSDSSISSHLPDKATAGVDFSAATLSLHGDLVGGDKIIGGDEVHGSKYVLTQELAYDVRGLANPYLGLAAFTYAERAKYAGHEKRIAETVAKITARPAPRPLLFVTGASGSGKSSFAQAGLLPALRGNYSALTVKQAVLRPGCDPLLALADALWRQLGLPLQNMDELKLDAVIDLLYANTPASQINLIILDQFEEFFTQAPQDAREQFFALLANLPPFSKSQTHIIATMRADYLPELFNHPVLYEIAKQGVDLRAMNVQELGAAIQQPLRAEFPDGTKRFQPELVEQLAEDASQDAAYLPLLQVTLQELWRKGSLMQGAYTHLAAAIKDRAGKVLHYYDYDASTPSRARPPAEQRAVLELLLGLVDVSLDDEARRDVRRRRTKSELANGSQDAARLVDELTGARLLSVGTAARDPNTVEVELIHESLLANWDQLRAAIAERRHELHQRARFEQNLNEWLKEARSDNYLLYGVRLAEARALAARDDIALRANVASEFLQASVARADAEQQAALERERQRAEALEQARWEADKRATAEKLRAKISRYAAMGLSVLLLGAVIAVVLALRAMATADVAANEARARLLVQQAAQVADADPLLGVRLALEGLGVAEKADAGTSLPISGVRLGLEGLTLKEKEDAGIQSSLMPVAKKLIEQGRILRLGGQISFSPSFLASPIVVSSNGDGTGEIHRMDDGSLVARLNGGPDNVLSDDTRSNLFVLGYSSAPGELRRWSDGSLVMELPDRVAGASFDDTSGASVFVVDYEPIRKPKMT